MAICRRTGTSSKISGYHNSTITGMACQWLGYRASTKLEVLGYWGVATRLMGWHFRFEALG